jgi:hypothetical protein
MQTHGVRDVLAHDAAPGFAPKPVRLMEVSTHAPDWQTRLSGWYLQRSMLDALHSGVPTTVRDTESYFPAMAVGVNFGEQVEESGLY